MSVTATQPTQQRVTVRSDAPYQAQPQETATPGPNDAVVAEPNGNDTSPASGKQAIDTSAVESPSPYGERESKEVTVGTWTEDPESWQDSTITGILREHSGYQDVDWNSEHGQALISEVSEVNNLDNPNLIHPGQTLVVPAGPSASSDRSAAAEAQSGDGPTPAEAQVEEQPSLTQAEALETLGQEYSWLADPQAGSPEEGASVNVDSGLRAFDKSSGDWNRDGYLENLTRSVNPETEQMYTAEEAAARADRLELAAETVLADEGALNRLNSSGDFDENGNFEFSVDDLSRSASVYDDEAQAALTVLDENRTAFAWGKPDNPADESRVYRSDLESISGLGENQNFQSFRTGELDWNAFQAADPEAAELFGRIHDKLPEGTENPVATVDATIEASNTLLDGDLFQTLNASDGNFDNHKGKFLSVDDISGARLSTEMTPLSQSELQEHFDASTDSWNTFQQSVEHVTEADQQALTTYTEEQLNEFVSSPEFGELSPDLQKEQLWMAQADAASALAAEHLPAQREAIGAPESPEAYHSWRQEAFEAASASDASDQALATWEDILRYETIAQIQVSGHDYVMNRGAYLNGGGRPNPEGW